MNSSLRRCNDAVSDNPICRKRLAKRITVSTAYDDALFG